MGYIINRAQSSKIYLSLVAKCQKNLKLTRVEITLRILIKRLNSTEN